MKQILTSKYQRSSPVADLYSRCMDWWIKWTVPSISRSIRQATEHGESFMSVLFLLLEMDGIFLGTTIYESTKKIRSSGDGGRSDNLLIESLHCLLLSTSCNREIKERIGYLRFWFGIPGTAGKASKFNKRVSDIGGTAQATDTSGTKRKQPEQDWKSRGAAKNICIRGIYSHLYWDRRFAWENGRGAGENR